MTGHETTGHEASGLGASGREATGHEASGHEATGEPVPDRAPFVVVGAGMAGGRAAFTLARATRRPVVLVGGEPVAPYDRTALSKAVLLGEAEPADIALHRPGQLQAAGVIPVLGRRACGFDPDRRVVMLDDGSSIAYGELLVATGRRARPLALGGARLVGVHTLRELDDALALRSALAAGRHVVVVGAGLVGLEVAAAARRHGCRVTVVDPAPYPLAGRLPEPVGEAVRRWHDDAGTDLRFGDRPAGFAGVTTLSHVVLAGGACLAVATAVVAVGSVPCTDWAAGLPVAADGTVPVDEAGRTAVDGVWACGDVASWCHPTLGPIVVEHETLAQAHARRVALAMAGRPPGAMPVPYAWSEQLGHRVEVAGVTSGDPEVVAVPGATGTVVAHRRGAVVVGVATADAPGVASLVLQRLQGGEPTTVDDVVDLVAPDQLAGAGGPGRAVAERTTRRAW